MVVLLNFETNTFFAKKFNLSRTHVTQEVFKHYIGSNKKINFKPTTKLKDGLEKNIENQKQIKN
jgi:dimeric dUTPase (all-alpha-NTP-PPase superfamily)